ncbi:MAG: tetratricopeptide repeat protein [Planctomycetota bacterium]|jgi:tetratricopeptide (TPR) repeat protein
MLFFLRLVLCTLVLLLFPTALWADEKPDAAETAFAKGEALLERGDVEGAFQAYVVASRTQPDNRAYAEKAMLLQRIQRLRQYVSNQPVSPKWEKSVVSLHAFYHEHQILEEALALDRMAHGKLDSALTASLLSESLLRTGRNTEALALLEEGGEEKLNIPNRIYLGIALARMKRLEEAGEQASQLNITPLASPKLFLDLARLHALLDNRETCFALLRVCFEKTSPSRLDPVKETVRLCGDFKQLKDTPGFKAAMKAGSKIQESGCSSGSSCGSCPQRTKCSSDASQEKNKDADEGCKECEGK